MKQSRGRLQTRIARHIAFAVVVSLVLSAALLVGSRHRFLRKAMEDSARTYASLISLPLAQGTLFYGTAGSDILSQQVARLREYNSDVIRLEVVRVTGEIVLQADRRSVVVIGESAVNPRITEPDLLRAIEQLDTVAGRVLAADGAEVYRVVAPAVEGMGRHAFSLVATFSYDNTNRQLRQALWLSAFVLAAGLALTYRVSVILARSITRDLESLRAGVQRIEEGHLDERVSIESHDEIEDLAETFNRMADELLATIRQLREANRELETLDQTKADLVANVSHELKTPLTALRGYLELLSDGGLGTISPEAVRATDICLKNVSRLSVRVEELVQVSRLDRYLALDAAREDVALGPLLEGVVETFQPRVKNEGLNCVIDLAPDLGSAVANQEQMERVFLNLFDNAVKFTPDRGTIVVLAEPCGHEGENGVLVRIKDSGVGIPPTELTRIFDRFYQVDPSARRRFGGMGLGLSLVRSIVEAHRGTVWAESEEGIGSTFFVWLPTHGSERGSGDGGGPPFGSSGPTDDDLGGIGEEI